MPMRIGTFLLLLPAIAVAQDFTALDRMASDELASQRLPGLVLVAAQGDRVTYAKGFGKASVETGEPVTPDHLFRVGSTTKMFVGAAVTVLAEQGRLKMDGPVGDFIRNLDPALGKLTAHQLLSHTSGLMDRTLMFGAHDDGALAANVAGLQPDTLFAKPGEIFSYSNLGYAVAGRLLETVTGLAFADAMKQIVFEPLGMKRTTFRPTIAMTYPLAQGHIEDSRQELVIGRPAADHSGYWPAGSMFTSGRDFARMAVAMMNSGRLDGQQALPAAVVAKMTSPHATQAGGASQYGYGIGVSNSGGVRVWSHGGARFGYSSHLVILPDQKAAVIAISNRSGANLTRLANKVVSRLAEVAPGPEPKRAGQAPVLSKLTGVYRQYTATVSVKEENGKLMVRAMGRTMRLEPAGGVCFRGEGAGMYCFTLDSAGRAKFVSAGSRSFARVD